MASVTADSSSLDGAAKTATAGTLSDSNVVDEVTWVVDHKAERRLCRQFDFRLLPVLAVMCRNLIPFARDSELVLTFGRPVQCPRQRQPGKCRNRWNE